MHRTLIILCLGLYTTQALSQQSNLLIPSDTLNTKRRNAVIISEATIIGLSLVALDQLWYSDFERSTFQFTSDIGDWNGIDKWGHIFSAYQLGRYGYNLLGWSGVKEKDRLLYGATLGFTFLTAIELMDAYSSEWGFSWGDMAANALGTGLFVGQQLLWNEQRISLKFSFQQSEYAALNPNQLGESLIENIFKDYNGQTYWLSFNLKSFFLKSFFPEWLNLAIGYGADGMLNGTFESTGLPDQDPFRQYYLSFDVDLTKIKTNSHFLKTVFDVINAIKIPSPTLEYTSKRGLKFHVIYF